MFNFLKNLFNPIPPRPANTGVVDAPPKETDYIAGATSPIIYQVVLQDGNWLTFTWSQVKQWCIKNGIYQDNLGCTGNYLATCIETQLYKITGKKIKVSRRWINKMSGCNQGALKGTGNYITAPMDWVRKNGFVLESSYPTPETWTVDEYYAPIPEPLNTQLLEEGKESLKKYSFLYERITDTSDTSINYHLKQAPLGCTIPGHQTCGVFSPDEYTTYRDSYEPWDKKEVAKNFQYLYKFIVIPTSIEAKVFKFNDSPELWIGHPLDSMQRLDKVKAGDLSWLDGYYLNEKIITLPIKKPL